MHIWTYVHEYILWRIVQSECEKAYNNEALNRENIKEWFKNMSTKITWRFE